MKEIRRKSLVAVLSIIIAMLGVAPAFADTNSDFESYMYDEWKETVEDDYLTMRTSLIDYKAQGIKKPEVTLGKIDYDEYKEAVDSADEALTKLHAFDPEELNETRKNDYHILEFYLNTMIGLYSYPQFADMFRPYIGQFTNLTDMFADFPFYEKEDVDDYLTLIGEIPSYIDKMMDFTSENASKGYFLDDISLTDAMLELNDFVESGERNPLIINFEDNLKKFEGLTEEEKKEYKEKNRELVLKGIIPKVTEVRGFLSKLKGSRKIKGSLAEDEDWQEYYRWLVRSSCSTEMSMEDIFEYLTKAIKECDAHYLELLEENKDFTEPGTISEPTDLEGLISYLRDHMEGFPEGPDVDYKISYLPDGSNDFAMAYYIPAPVDDINSNIIRVNKSETDDTNTLYFTLAHEGIPGHMYQFTWFQNTEGYVPLRHELGFSGYEEGWANYVERIMLERSGLDQVSADSISCDEFLAYTMNAAADIAVNGLGYDQKKLKEWLEDIGLGDQDAKYIYDMSVEMPGAYLPYGFGSAMFWGLRQRTEDALGSDFDLEEFHKCVLSYGPRPFEMVEKDLKEYVESKGGTLPDDFTFFKAAEGAEASISGSVVPIWIPLAAIAVIILIVIIVASKRKTKNKNNETEL